MLADIHYITLHYIANSMSGKKYGRGRRPVSDPNAFRVSDKTPEGPPVELENQFILRLPGKVIRE